MEREGDWKTSFQTQPKTKPLHDGTLVPLPSDLMIWVCSHFHSDRKGTMRKIKEAARKTNQMKIVTDPQWPAQSLCLTSTETLLTKTSECNHLAFSKCSKCSVVPVWQCRALRQFCSADPHGLSPAYSVWLHLKTTDNSNPNIQLS